MPQSPLPTAARGWPLPAQYRRPIVPATAPGRPAGMRAAGRRIGGARRAAADVAAAHAQRRPARSGWASRSALGQQQRGEQTRMYRPEPPGDPAAGRRLRRAPASDRRRTTNPWPTPGRGQPPPPPRPRRRRPGAQAGKLRRTARRCRSPSGRSAPEDAPAPPQYRAERREGRTLLLLRRHAGGRPRPPARLRGAAQGSRARRWCDGGARGRLRARGRAAQRAGGQLWVVRGCRACVRCRWAAGDGASAGRAMGRSKSDVWE